MATQNTDFNHAGKPPMASSCLHPQTFEERDVKLPSCWLSFLVDSAQHETESILCTNCSKCNNLPPCRALYHASHAANIFNTLMKLINTLALALAANFWHTWQCIEFRSVNFHYRNFSTTVTLWCIASGSRTLRCMGCATNAKLFDMKLPLPMVKSHWCTVTSLLPTICDWHSGALSSVQLIFIYCTMSFLVISIHTTHLDFGRICDRLGRV